MMLEILDDSFEVGQQLVFDDVLMVGTPEYTAIGRPSVENARVYVTLEEITRSEKVIVFKKKKRKGYQKSQGHKQMLHFVRVDRIEHGVSEDKLGNGEGVEIMQRKLLNTKWQ